MIRSISLALKREIGVMIGYLCCTHGFLGVILPFSLALIDSKGGLGLVVSVALMGVNMDGF